MGKIIFNIVAAVAVLGSSLVAIILAPPPKGNPDYTLGYRMGSFAGSLMVIVLIAWLFSFLFRKSRETAFRVLVIVLSVLTVLAHLEQWRKSLAP